MNRSLIIGVVGGILVVAAVIWTLFIDRAPDRQATPPAPVVQADGAGTAAPSGTPQEKPATTASAPEATAPKSEAAQRTAVAGTGTAPPSTAGTPASRAQPAEAADASGKAKADGTAVVEKEVKPSFDVVRINPRGDAVIAGRAAPNAEVTIKDGEKVIGTVKADGRGEWVQVPEKALPPGPRELSLSAKSPEKEETVQSEEKVVLVVPEKGKDIAGRETGGAGGALVLAVPRDGSSGVKVLQTPGPPTAPPSTASSSEPPTSGQQKGEMKVAMAPATSSAAPNAEPVPAPAGDAPKTASGSPQGTTSAPETMASSGGGEPSPAATTPERRPGDAAIATPETPTSTSRKHLATRALPQATVSPPTEASRGPASKPPAAPEQRTAETGSATAPTAVATPEQTPARETVLAAGPAQTTSRSAEDSGLVARDLSLDAIDYDDTGNIAVSGKAKPGAAVRVYLDNKPMGTATAEENGRWMLQPGDRVAPGIYKMRVDHVDGAGKVVARIETRFSRAAPLAGLPRDSIVFVQPGNSLWRIARRTYGEGLRYTVIFEANREQIRDPDLIYPGQVFQLPRVN